MLLRFLLIALLRRRLDNQMLLKVCSVHVPSVGWFSICLVRICYGLVVSNNSKTVRRN